ncbi:MAG TPA: hypothetical protein DCP90_06550 [Clostridiales bacterium]|nr:MAG: hypothetical protein A2Y22_00725 [Clostridiales bacterium GWD2_32_59]HAN10253.1 hypothetical protein [Clostridiales bacterium]
MIECVIESTKEIEDLKSYMEEINVLKDFSYIFDGNKRINYHVTDDGELVIDVTGKDSDKVETVKVFEENGALHIEDFSKGQIIQKIEVARNHPVVMQNDSESEFGKIVTKYKDGEIYSEYGVGYQRGTLKPEKKVYCRYEKDGRTLKISKDRAVSTIDIYGPLNASGSHEWEEHQKCVFNEAGKIRGKLKGTERNFGIKKCNYMNEGIKGLIMYDVDEKGESCNLDFTLDYTGNIIDNTIRATIKNTVNPIGYINNFKSASPIVYICETPGSDKEDDATIVGFIPSMEDHNGHYRKQPNSYTEMLTGELEAIKCKNKEASEKKEEIYRVKLTFGTGIAYRMKVNRYSDLLQKMPDISEKIEENLDICDYAYDVVNLMRFVGDEVKLALDYRQEDENNEEGQSDTMFEASIRELRSLEGLPIDVITITSINNLQVLDGVENLTDLCMVGPIMSKYDIKMEAETDQTQEINM